MENRYSIDINISVSASDSIEANQKCVGMLNKLEMLLGYTSDVKCDCIYDSNSILNFNIQKLEKEHQ